MKFAYPKTPYVKIFHKVQFTLFWTVLHISLKVDFDFAIVTLFVSIVKLQLNKTQV